MDRVEPILRTVIGSAPSVGAAARIRRLDRDQERQRGEGHDGGSERDDAADEAPDDGLPHVDVLA